VSPNRRHVLAALGGLAFTGSRAMADTPFPRLQALIDRTVGSGEVPGLAVGVEANGRPVEWRAAGTIALDSDQPIGPRTVCRVASMTKLVAGVTALQLVEDGMFGLDQPIHEIAPEFREMKVVRADGSTEAARRPITVRHLLNFTAGIPHVWQGGPASIAYREAGLDKMGHHQVVPVQPQDAPAPRTLEEWALRLAKLPLASHPGEDWHYGYCMDVMGFVMERATRTPFAELLRERTLRPLKMDDTDFFVRPDQVDRLATNYTRTDGKLAVFDDRKASKWMDREVVPSGGGGLVSTGADYARFCRMLLNGGELDGVRVASARAVKTATSNLLPPEVERPQFVLDRADWGAGAAVHNPDSVAPGRSVGSYGWAGGTGGTAFWVDPAKRFFVVVMMQRMMGDPNDTLHRQIELAVAKDLGLA